MTSSADCQYAGTVSDGNDERDNSMKKSDARDAGGETSPSDLIDARIEGLGDWRGGMLARLRSLIREADPEGVEAVKWRKPSNMLGVPVWEHDGIICTGETYKDKVKLTFARGASLEDPSGLFNSSLDGNVRRAIDFREGDGIDEAALTALVRAAVARGGGSPGAGGWGGGFSFCVGGRAGPSLGGGGPRGGGAPPAFGSRTLYSWTIRYGLACWHVASPAVWFTISSGSAAPAPVP